MAKTRPWKSGSEIQTLLFARDVFTKKQAKAWARSHDFLYGSVDTTAGFYRLRQADPSAFKTLRTKTLTEGVKAVLGPLKRREAAAQCRRNPVPHILVSFEKWTPEDVEHGAPSESGWVEPSGPWYYEATDPGYKGEPVEPDAYDIDAAEDAGLDPVVWTALEMMGSDLEPSSYPFSRGTWYTEYTAEEDFGTGEIENRSYHLEGFTEAQEKAIYNKLTR